MVKWLKNFLIAPSIKAFAKSEIDTLNYWVYFHEKKTLEFKERREKMWRVLEA